MNKTMKTCSFLGASLALVLSSISSSHAAAVLIQNQSFELPGGANNQYPPATFWVDSSFTEISADVGITGGTGPRHNGQNMGASATQDLGVTFLTDTLYTLTIAIGNRTNDNSNPTGTAVFGLTANGTDLGTFTSAVSLPNTFQDFTYTFTTGAVAPTGNVTIRLGNLNNGRGLFDNVRLDVSPVPEPSATIFALMGGLLIARRRRS